MKHKYIIATRTFTYSVEEIRDDLNSMNDEDATDEEIWDMVEEWLYEDMVTPVSSFNMTLTDENGNKLERELD